MSKLLRVIIVEDSEDDALLTVLALEDGGYDPVYERVEDAGAMRKALSDKPWDVILCDYQMPQFNGLAAIAVLKETGIDIPLIIVSGAVGEETAVECMRLGACDYIMKGNLTRLVSAVERELKDAESRLQRKRAELALKESEQRLKDIIFNIADWVWEVDGNGIYTYSSQKGYELFGEPDRDIIGKSPFDFMPPDEAKRVSKIFYDSIASKAPIKDLENCNISRNGEIIYLLTNGVPILDGDGNLKGYRGVDKDITERKLAEEQLVKTLESLRRSYGTTIQVMVSAVETRDPYTSGHQKRSADLAISIAMEMGLSTDILESIRMAGPIHDIGKLSIPAEILSRPSKLSEIEYSLVKEHARTGFEILKDVESPWPLAEIVYQHHERMDGSGYPRNLKGNGILMEARILAVADVVEAMSSHRPYRPALGINAALEEIENNKETLYDTDVADACLRLFREKGFQIANA